MTPEKESHVLDGKRAESVAVGSESFVTARKGKLGFKAKERKVIGVNGSYELTELLARYRGPLRDENEVLRPENGYFWEDTSYIST